MQNVVVVTSPEHRACWSSGFHASSCSTLREKPASPADSARPAKQWQDAFITRHTNAIIPHPAFDLNIKHHRSGKASTCKRSFNLERGVIYADYLTFMILDADIVITDKDVRYPSDHFPVTATIDFKK